MLCKANQAVFCAPSSYFHHETRCRCVVYTSQYIRCLFVLLRCLEPSVLAPGYSARESTPFWKWAQLTVAPTGCPPCNRSAADSHRCPVATAATTTSHSRRPQHGSRCCCCSWHDAPMPPREEQAKKEMVRLDTRCRNKEDLSGDDHRDPESELHPQLCWTWT